MMKFCQMCIKNKSTEIAKLAPVWKHNHICTSVSWELCCDAYWMLVSLALRAQNGRLAATFAAYGPRHCRSACTCPDAVLHQETQETERASQLLLSLITRGVPG